MERHTSLRKLGEHDTLPQRGAMIHATTSRFAPQKRSYERFASGILSKPRNGQNKVDGTGTTRGGREHTTSLATWPRKARVVAVPLIIRKGHWCNGQDCGASQRQQSA
jgi:hypothetical protein